MVEGMLHFVKFHRTAVVLTHRCFTFLTSSIAKRRILLKVSSGVLFYVLLIGELQQGAPRSILRP